MKNAVIYARYSSERQTEQSIEGQLRVCYDFALKHDYNIIDSYIDRAMSGRNDHREAFQKMIKDSAQKNFEAIIVYKLDRFSRNRYDSAHNKNILKKYGVKVISATEGISDNPEGILLESLLEGLAEYYSAELSQKVRRGLKESVLKGQFTGGSPPYGYDIVDKKYIINSEEAKIVNKIYDLFLTTKSFVSVQKYLNDNKIKNKKGNQFKNHQLTNILTKELYIGTLCASDMKIENKIPAIVSKEKFMQVKNILSTHTQKHRNINFILTGKLYCGDCNGLMTGTSGTGRSKKYFYYECKKDKHTIGQDYIEKKISEAISKMLSSPKNLNNLAVKIDDYLSTVDSIKEKDIVKKRLIKIEKEIENITSAILNGIVNDNIKNKNNELLEEKDVLIKKLNKLAQTEKYTGQQIVNFLKSISLSQQQEDKALLINTLLYKAILYKDKVIIILNIRDEGNQNSNFVRKCIELELEEKVVRLNSPSLRQSISRLNTDKFRYVFTKGVAGVIFYRDR